MALTALIQRIEELRQEFAGYQPLPQDAQEKLDKKFRLEFNYNSNHIEGNTLTYGETQLLLFFGKTEGQHDIREYEEMKGSDVALKMVQEHAADKERGLTEGFIKNLNKIILVRPYWANAITPDGQPTRREISIGNYKKHPNSVRLQSGEMFHYASPEETPALMGDLVAWYKAELEKNELHPIALAALLHYKFVRIHPFDDGNGRISRLLMNYVLYCHNLPPVIIKSTNKKDYLFALNQADSGNLNAFVEYVAQQMSWSLDIAIKAAKGESIEEQDDLEKEITLWKVESKNRLPKEKTLKSSTVLRKLYIEYLGELIKLFDEKFIIFSDMFIRYNCIGLIDDLPIERFSAGSSVDSFFGLPFGKIGLFQTAHENINSMTYNIQMYGFKNNIRTQFNVEVKFRVEFSPYYYNIKINLPQCVQSYEKEYNATITEIEQQTIVNEAVKELFAYIKSQTDTPIS